MSDLTRKRGDTYPIELAVTDSGGTAVDISGYSFTLTVDPNQKPTDNSTKVFEITGTITDAPAGLVEFDITAQQADLVGTYWYDIQQTDSAGDIETLVEGKIKFGQDITK